MDCTSYAVILNPDGEVHLKKIDDIQYANDLPYVVSKGFSYDGHFAQLAIPQDDKSILQIQIPVQHVLGTVVLADNKKVAGFVAS